MKNKCNCDLAFLCEYCEPLEAEKIKEMEKSYRMEYIPERPDIRNLALNERLKWGYFKGDYA